jgi:hypothetical protein
LGGSASLSAPKSPSSLLFLCFHRTSAIRPMKENRSQCPERLQVEATENRFRFPIGVGSESRTRAGVRWMLGACAELAPTGSPPPFPGKDQTPSCQTERVAWTGS